MALAQLLDEIVGERAIDVGEEIGILCEQVLQGVERGLEVVVVGMHAYAQALRDLGPFSVRRRRFSR